MIVRYPIPITDGYIHLGDAFVILSGLILGPVNGAIAGGLGAALTDILGGYAHYAPVTLVIKAVMAVGVWAVYYRLLKNKKSIILKCLIAGLVAAFLNVAGYLTYEYIIYGAAALVSVPGNIIQGVFGVVISSFVYPYLNRIKANL